MSCFGRPLRDDLLAVHALRHVDQQPRDAAVDVEQREAADLAVGVAQPPHEPAHHRHRHVEMLGEELLEILLRERDQLARLDRHHRRRARAVVDQAHLAEEFPRAEHREDHFLAFGVAHHHLQAPGDDEVERVGRVAFDDHDRAARHVAPVDGATSSLSCSSGKPAKSGTVRSTVVETGIAMAERPLEPTKQAPMVADRRFFAGKPLATIAAAPRPTLLAHFCICRRAIPDC
jgi:hypothetical protein